MTRAWIAVACAEHVRRGVELGLMQVCHGKAAPLRRLKPGDRVTYYSPVEQFRGSERLQCFTAFGTVLDDTIEQVDMGGGFRPYRRAVRWLKADPAPIRLLLGMPGFALSGQGWGARLRYGLVAIDPASMDLIAAAMGVGDAMQRADLREAGQGRPRARSILRLPPEPPAGSSGASGYRLPVST